MISSALFEARRQIDEENVQENPEDFQSETDPIPENVENFQIKLE